MDQENMKILIMQALSELNKAQKDMRTTIKPHVDIPRPRRFLIAPGIEWPYIAGSNCNYQNLCILVNEKRYSMMFFEDSIADEILLKCQYRPRLVLRALRRIQAATAWCEARAEGRKRAAEEILSQQRKAVEMLELEAALLALKQETGY